MLERGRDSAAQDHEPEEQRPDDERERREEAPTGNVVFPRRPARADRLERWRRFHADAERVHARGRVPVLSRHAPAHRKRRPAAEPRDTRGDDVAVRRELRRPGEDLAVGREHLDRVRGDRHRFVELQTNLGRRGADPRLRLGRRGSDRRVRTRRGRYQERHCDRGAEGDPASHLRTTTPSKWPKIGAESRSE